LPFCVKLQLMQMWERWFNCDNGFSAYEKREKTDDIPKCGSDLSTRVPVKIEI